MPEGGIQDNLLAFNRGLVSPKALARTDLKRLALSAQRQTNWMPSLLGPMMLRAGWEYIAGTNGNARPKYLPFVFATTDVSLVELTPNAMRIIGGGSDGTPTEVLSRVAVSAVVVNGNFNGDISSWNVTDDAGASTVYVASNQMGMTGTGFARAVVYQGIFIGVGDVGKEHAVRIVVNQGPVVLNIGNSFNSGEYAFNLRLGTGSHSIAFTPTQNFVITFSNGALFQALIGSVAIEAVGPVVLPTPWDAISLYNPCQLRSDQSGEVMYVARTNLQQRKILRWGPKNNTGNRSWSIVLFEPLDGPFLPINITSTTITPSDIKGIITLTASAPLFRSGHVRALFRLASVGQTAEETITGTNQFSSAIQVTGLDNGGGRQIVIAISGIFAGTIVLQQSVGVIGNWQDVSGQSWTGPVNTNYDDGLDNQIMFYRIGVEAAAHAFGAFGFGVNPSNGDTLNFNGSTWTFVTGTASANQTQIFGTLAGTLEQLVADLTASADANVVQCSYASTATSLNITFKTPGSVGNAFTISASAASASGATLAGGTNVFSGIAQVFLSSTVGSITGICRVLGVTSSTLATAEVLIQPGNTGTLAGLGSSNATNQWWEGQWSNQQGYPGAVALYQGRLWSGGSNAIIGSISDSYESYDDTVEGDSGVINEVIGSGPVDTINWLLPLVDLILGTQGSEKDVRSAILGSVITPTEFNMIDASTQGSAEIAGVKIDYNGLFVDRTATRLYELQFTPSFFQLNYASVDLTRFVPDIAILEDGVLLPKLGFYSIVVQRKPDTLVHCVMNDGTVRVCLFEPTEEANCFIKVDTDGEVIDALTLPSPGATAGYTEDLVYYGVQREINGIQTYTLERWAEQKDCIGNALSKLADCHLIGTNESPSALISLPHLPSTSNIVVWADGVDQSYNNDGSNFTTDAEGNITLPVPVTTWCAGLYYEAQFQSTKLLFATQDKPIGYNKPKNIKSLGVMLANAHYQSLRYGRDFDHLNSMPLVYSGKPVAPNTVFTAYEDVPVAFNGTWNTDSRMCLTAAAPRPVTVLAAITDVLEG